MESQVSETRLGAPGGEGDAMNAFIDFAFGHRIEFFYIILGIGVILYSCFAKRMSFEGDFAVRPEERQTYKATPEMRKYGISLGMLPLIYGLYELLSSLVANGGGVHMHR
ncbi:MAG TPA: hypothetical protein VFC37_19830 [Terracidiphilus sp.]|nr:hypothetical protein [Terracidiphilus sp.]